VDATLGYAGSYTVRGQGGGTLTWLPPAGQVIGQGHVLYKVDNGSPVVLLDGSVPAWRTLDEGLTGADVSQLNHDLVRLGYAGSADIAALGWDYYSWETRAGVEQLQSALGISSPSGTLPLGSVVFEPEALRVSQVTGHLGDPASGPVLNATSARHQVTISLDASQQTDVKAGDTVTVTLPDGTATPGVISSGRHRRHLVVRLVRLGRFLVVRLGRLRRLGRFGRFGDDPGACPAYPPEGGGAPGPGAGDGEHHHRHRAQRPGGPGERAAGPARRQLRRGDDRAGEHPALGKGDRGDLRRRRRASPGHRDADARAARCGALGMSGDTPVLELAEVSKEYPVSPPVRALDAVSVSVAAGELVAVVGPSESGKSTLLHLMGTLDKPTSGTVRVTGTPGLKVLEPQAAMADMPGTPSWRSSQVRNCDRHGHLIWQHAAQLASGRPGFRAPRGHPADRPRWARDFRQQHGSIAQPVRIPAAGCAADPDPRVTSFTGRPTVSAGGRSGGADPPAHVSVSAGTGPALPVTHLRGGCHVVRVCPGRRGRDLRLPADADNSRYRASGRREHQDADQLAPAPAPWLRRLEPPRGRGQPRRDLGRDAVLQDLPRALDLRRRPGARFVHAPPRSCSGAPGKRLQLTGDRLDLSRRLARAVPGAAGLRAGLVVSSRAGH
jgi:hypothetical protein